jgi:hypothetical protein
MPIRVTRLFAIPVIKVHVPETEALKQQFLPEMLRRYQARPYDKPALWETDRIHTSFEAESKDHVIDFMHSMPTPYDRLLRQFVRADQFNVELWHNVYWTGQEYQERHHHIPCHFSFIHFLAFDESEHKPPIFYDPARDIKAHCCQKGLAPEIWEDEAVIDVKEGDALVFPSYLEHLVPPGKYTKPRVTVSMNVTLLGK